MPGATAKYSSSPAFASQSRTRTSRSFASRACSATRAFNCSETIYNAISSIVDQNYLDLEIIYCDDCSEDDSVNVVKRIANKNKSIKIFQSDKNRGPGYLRNTGTKLASGRFVIYLDADDWLEMGILGKLANVINSHPSIELIEYRINIVKNNVSEEANWLNRGENGIRYTDKEDILLAT